MQASIICGTYVLYIFDDLYSFSVVVSAGVEVTNTYPPHTLSRQGIEQPSIDQGS